LEFGQNKGMRAPEFPHDIRWLNLPRGDAKSQGDDIALRGSPPPSMKEMRGKNVVLVDFWTYSCVNCIRTLPYLKQWHEKYATSGLVIVGVHTPEFEFEKDLTNIQSALKRFEIPYPIVVDSDYQVWSLYSNNVWPRKFLMDKDGQMVYNHAGEGNYRETEEQIQKALLGLDPKLKLPEIEVGPSFAEDSADTKVLADKSESKNVCLPATGETYLGAMRGHPGRVWRAEGEWRAYPEYMEHMRTTERFEDYLALNFEAGEVNLVMEARTERPAKVRVELGGSTRSVPSGVEGLTAGGKLVQELEVREPKMYNLFKETDHNKHAAFPRRELKIFVKDAGVRMYAFTFGGCG